VGQHVDGNGAATEVLRYPDVLQIAFVRRSADLMGDAGQADMAAAEFADDPLAAVEFGLPALRAVLLFPVIFGQK
jgi:hypothetical protein